MDDQQPRRDIRPDMGQRSRSRPLALALALIPGWGHIYWSREGLGLLFFTLAAPCFFSLVYSYVLYVGPYRGAWIQISAACLALVYVGSWVELFLRSRPERVEAETEVRSEALERGTILYVKGDLEGAAQQFRRCLEIDPFDMEAQFRVGVVLARLGATREARGWLRRARKYDADGKWEWEIRNELKRLRLEAKRNRAGRGAPPRQTVASEEAQGS